MDYNTPVGNPELKDALLWPSGCQELRVRSVYVPPGVHAFILRHRLYRKVCAEFEVLLTASPVAPLPRMKRH